jgi:ketosteroid isomerase-like protein
MKWIFVALASAALAAGTAFASERDDVMVPIRQFVNAFNGGDTKTALAACAEQASVIDEFPPYAWHGAGACGTWAQDFDADAKRNGITDGVVTLGKPRHVNVTGDRAYVVIPADYAYKQKGKAVREVGSLMTVALQKGAGGWRMTGWAWTKR